MFMFKKATIFLGKKSMEYAYVIIKFCVYRKIIKILIIFILLTWIISKKTIIKKYRFLNIKISKNTLKNKKINNKNYIKIAVIILLKVF